MTEGASAGDADASWVALPPRERRVLGVLVEKAKTTPEYYPLSVAATVTGCNQKSNRDPVTNYDQDDVEDTLHSLRKKGAVILVEGSGRVARWKHTLYDWMKVSKVELAVMAELLLRGPQTEGDLRARASRMEPLADLPALQAILEALAARRLVHYLSPPGQKRGVYVSHGLYPSEELDRIRQAFSNRHAADEETTSRSLTTETRTAGPSIASASSGEILAVRAEVDQLRETLTALVNEVRELKAALGV